ncbi:hypothetical protein [Bacillus sp. PS06]|uniref:hypothetical protein n=1 Tax=Bacillus sp. PS06 TaxID=2764176 RepID=UPI00177EC04E|nr:hypothetical protein [Bacillus sp. PS06]MBD8070846.1 hypothetical protein [Bacillus sp. PS06]
MKNKKVYLFTLILFFSSTFFSGYTHANTDTQNELKEEINKVNNEIIENTDNVEITPQYLVGGGLLTCKQVGTSTVATCDITLQSTLMIYSGHITVDVYRIDNFGNRTKVQSRAMNHDDNPAPYTFHDQADFSLAKSTDPILYRAVANGYLNTSGDSPTYVKSLWSANFWMGSK